MKPSEQLRARRFLLWLTGRDLLAPPPPTSIPGEIRIRYYPPAKFVMMPTGDEFLQFHVPVAPNFIHRLLQRLILGIKWRMYVEGE